MQDRLFYSSNNYVEAKQVQDLLDQNNIVNYLKNEHIQNLFGDTRFLLGKDIIAGDIKIMVSEADFGRACAVIEESGLLSQTETGTETQAGTEAGTETHGADGGSGGEVELPHDGFRGKPAEPNTNVFQMVLFSFFSFLVFPIFINIKNFIHFWNTRRAAVIMSLVLTVLVLPLPIIVIIENFYAAAPLLYVGALTGAIGLMIKGYKRFKKRHDVVSLLMALPFVLVLVFPFIMQAIAGVR